jgi:hypothetical protein
MRTLVLSLGSMFLEFTLFFLISSYVISSIFSLVGCLNK